MERSAIFSECGRFRFLLIRIWDWTKPVLPAVWLNPSKASAEVDDPSSRKGVGFAERHGFGGLALANVYPYCATDPKDLKRAGYPRHAQNFDFILRAAKMGDGRVWCGWGSNAKGLTEPDVVMRALEMAGFELVALRLTADGLPCHPLMLPYTCTLSPFRKNSS